MQITAGKHTLSLGGESNRIDLGGTPAGEGQAGDILYEQGDGNSSAFLISDGVLGLYRMRGTDATLVEKGSAGLDSCVLVWQDFFSIFPLRKNSNLLKTSKANAISETN